jgi:hypothetical protein
VGYAGTKLGAKRGTSLRQAEVPLNYPELVDEFRWFLGQTARLVGHAPSGAARRRPTSRSDQPGDHDRVRGSVLVGIDELDRISDGEQAQKFINELKAVFNIPNCYFLVSVSEDALAEFELSAMGMRTVFDSAFDDVLRVDYLRLPEAQAMLDRLIVGLPRSYVALAYVLSGGLARQLERVSNHIALMGRTGGPRPMDEVAATLVERQLHRTCRAALDQLFRFPDKAAAAELARVIDDHPQETVSAPALRAFEGQVRGVEITLTDEVAPIMSLRAEVVAMANYLATVLEVFADEHLTQERFDVGLKPGPGNFESLARARRYLGANALGAEELLGAFRSEWASATGS